MAEFYDPAFARLVTEKYIGRDGRPVPQHVPGREPYETPDAHARRLYSLGYTLADANALAGIAGDAAE
ncbi:hypothetical protein [Dactylosporangium sp. NPDC005555]|uniref:hypothetical protein n=1 Tax=Dactylosporangium sp. NPDC005555 TaxID=3154889 RepID=UPI0033BAB656